MARSKVTINGLKELDRALGEMPKATARNVMHRALKASAAPLVARAQSLAPVDTGELQRSIIVSTKVQNFAGLAEYGKVIEGGGSRGDAVRALRSARRAAGADKTFASVSVGPAPEDKDDAIKSIVQEFGSSRQEPRAYMRPAWDQTRERVRDMIKDNLAAEIEKAAARAARKAAKVKT